MMQKSDLTDLEIETQDLKLRLARPSSAQSTNVSPPEVAYVAPPPQVISSASKTSVEEGVHIFKSPMVGTFYRKPSPDDPYFVSIGDKISNSSVLCIIEAMKVMNEIQSDKDGEIIEILVEDSVSVEYGQPLFKIRL